MAWGAQHHQDLFSGVTSIRGPAVGAECAETALRQFIRAHLPLVLQHILSLNLQGKVNLAKAPIRRPMRGSTAAPRDHQLVLTLLGTVQEVLIHEPTALQIRILPVDVLVPVLTALILTAPRVLSFMDMVLPEAPLKDPLDMGLPLMVHPGMVRHPNDLRMVLLRDPFAMVLRLSGMAPMDLHPLTVFVALRLKGSLTAAVRISAALFLQAPPRRLLRLISLIGRNSPIALAQIALRQRAMLVKHRAIVQKNLIQMTGLSSLPWMMCLIRRLLSRARQYHSFLR